MTELTSLTELIKNNVTNIDTNIDTNIKNNLNIEDLLDTEIVVFSYVTLNDEPGTIIVNTNVNASSNLETYFNCTDLFIMEKTVKKKIKLRDLLLNGVTTIGSTDTMETLQINIPDKRISSKKPSIVGKFMHGSRKHLIAVPLDIDFDYDPESEPEPDNTDFDFDIDDDVIDDVIDDIINNNNNVANVANVDNVDNIVNSNSNKKTIDIDWLCAN